MVPPKPCEVRLTVIQVTDVYTLANLPSLKTLIAETKAANFPGSVISVLTGDFLAPYLLSSVDKGAGMMSALAKCPIDYLTWGNHEADIDHRTVCSHVRAFPGTWLNTNMQSHAAMDAQKAYDVVELTSQDGSQTRRIGLVAVLSDDPALYLHFKPPGAFGGAKIECPWQTLSSYKSKLEGPEERCDVVLPLQHMYVPDDHRTCREFDFPVVLSGHDHHRVDEVIAGTRLLKPGLDAIAATVLQLSWPSAASPSRPRFVPRSSRWPTGDRTRLCSVRRAGRTLRCCRCATPSCRGYRPPSSLYPLPTLEARCAQWESTSAHCSSRRLTPCAASVRMPSMQSCSWEEISAADRSILLEATSLWRC